MDEAIQAKISAQYAAEMAQQQRCFSGSPIPGPLNRAAPPADFYSLLARLRDATINAREVAVHADSIASTIHGHRSEKGCADSCEREQRVGLIGQYDDALDELRSALSDARDNLRRISNGIPDASKGLVG